MFQNKCFVKELKIEEKEVLNPYGFEYFKLLGKGAFGEVYLV